MVRNGLPDGWTQQQHEHYGVDFFIHTASLVCSWTRPYYCASNVPTHEAPPADELDLINLIATEEANAVTQKASIIQRASEHADLDPECAAPLMDPSVFNFSELPRDVKMQSVPIKFLQQFCEAMFGSSPKYVTMLADWGDWRHPPHMTTVDVAALRSLRCVVTFRNLMC